jgi:beta-mannanase
VDLQSASLAGKTNLVATAWFYTPDSRPARMIVQEELAELAAVETKSAGWHSVSVPLSWSQPELDELSLGFQKGSSSTAPPAPRIYSAFIELSYTAPEHQVYWGSWIDGDVYTKAGESAWPDAPWEKEGQPTWDTFQSHAGNKPVSIVHFGQPAPWNQSFSAVPLNNTTKRGAIPMMDMDPDGVTLASLASGAKDTSLEKWAADVRAYEKPFFFRWSWEMNGSWFKPYGPESADSPELYKSVWRRFHDIAEAAGATNITWVWCPNVSFSGSTSLSALYPGNAYVDWTCMDGYNRGTNSSSPEGWRTFSQIFSQTYSEVLVIAPSKPIMVGEVGSTEITNFSPNNKPDWIAEAFGNTLPTAFPKIKAVLWFNWNIVDEKTGLRWDWPIESSAASQSSFANVISSPFYASNTFGSLPTLTKIQPLP